MKILGEGNFELLRRLVSIVLVFLLVLDALGLEFRIQRVWANGTIHINADGSISPSTTLIQTVDNFTYVFTDNIDSSIVVERDNVVIDGNGYELQGTNVYDSKGIGLSGIANVTIENTQIKAFWYGIWLNASSDDSISGNDLANNSCGVQLIDCSNIMVENIDIFDNTAGLQLYGTNSSKIADSNITGNRVSVEFSSCSNSVVYGNVVSNNNDGVQLYSSSNNSVYDNNLTANYSGGVSIRSSSDNTVYGNDVEANSLFGIRIDVSSTVNAVSKNNVERSVYGIIVSDSSYGNTIFGNNVTGNAYGVFLFSSSESVISENNLTASSFDGVFLEGSSNNTIVGNSIVANNHDGVELINSSNNVLYHNNFVRNPAQADNDSTDVWDDDYPGGGNFWIDYNGSDERSGPNQDLPGNDGIGDTPYVIDSNNKDNYPLMKPWGELEVHNVAVASVIADRTWVYQGFSVSVNVTTIDKGNFDENVTVTLYYDVTAKQIIGSQTGTLSAGQNQTLAFLWDTDGVPYCKNYTITATVSLEADDYEADNTLDGKPVSVRILGDVDGSNEVNILDLIILATHFGLKLGDAGWNPDVDLNGDGQTDILDAIVISLHFGMSFA